MDKTSIEQGEIDFSKLEYAGFLEDFVRNIVGLDPVSIGVCALLEDGRALTGYYGASPSDKALFAHHFQSDALQGEIEASRSWLRDLVEGGEDSSEDGSEE